MVSARFIFKLIYGVIYQTVIFGGLLFWTGHWRWPRAWWFLAINLVATLVMTVTIFPSREDLLNERFKPPIQKGQPLADKVLLVLVIVTFCGFVGFIPVDVFRLHLFRKPGPLVSSLGLILFLAGWTIMSLALKENAFAAPIVKHQEERNQTVVDRGVYSVVRHPMYAGAVPLLIGIPLWLESYAAALLAIVPILLLAVRI
jgi:protein-S-isoprenylcysteine O-methyltransferase Ste14